MAANQAQDEKYQDIDVVKFKNKVEPLVLKAARVAKELIANMQADSGNLPEELQKQYDNLTTLVNDLTKNWHEAESAESRLQQMRDDPDFGTWLGDNVFRWDNPDRLNTALTRLSEYQLAIEKGSNLATGLRDGLPNLGHAYISMESWQSTISSLIPLIALETAVPNLTTDKLWGDYHFNANAFEAVATVQIGVSSIGVFAGIGAPAIAAVLAALAITVIVGGIIAGEENKELYENIASQASTATATVNEKIVTPLTQAQNDVSTFWTNTAQALATAGYIANVAAATPVLCNTVLQAVAMEAKAVAGYLATFEALNKAAGDGITVEMLRENAKIATAAIQNDPTTPDSDKQTIINELLVYYYIQKGTIDAASLAKEVGIPESEVAQYKAILYLREGKTPDEIVQLLGIDKTKVEAIQTVLNVSKEH